MKKNSDSIHKLFHFRIPILMRFLLFLSIGGTPRVLAQANFVYAGYTTCSWDRITLTDSSYQSADTSIVFVTTRNPFPGAPRQTAFLGEAIASDSLLRFYTIYFKGNNWKAAPRKNLTDALRGNSLSADFVVYTEGDGKTFPDATDRATRLCRLYNLSVVMFDWPSRASGFGAVKNVLNTVRNSKLLGKQYHTFLLLLQEYRLSHPEKIAHLSLFFHSLGNAVFRNAIQKTGSSGYKQGFVDNLILNAACIPVRGHTKWLETLSFQNQVYVIYNRKDKTLREASLLFHKRMLGCQLSGPRAGNSIYVNIHQVALNKHNYFLIIPLLIEHPELKTFFQTILHSQTPPFSNPALFTGKKNGREYLLR